MSRPAIIINELDAERLDRLLEQPLYANQPVAEALNAELDRAEMLSPASIPADVVTMNSRVKFRDITTQEERIRTLVYPASLTDSDNQLSVMAPVGAALLGLRVGDTINWTLPGGNQTHLEVLELQYQPEAAGEYHRYAPFPPPFRKGKTQPVNMQHVCAYVRKFALCGQLRGFNLIDQRCDLTASHIAGCGDAGKTRRGEINGHHIPEAN